MRQKDRFAEIKRCLALADEAFARARACGDEHERAGLIDEAEAWLVAAENAFGRLTDRRGLGHAGRVPHEPRSFRDPQPTTEPSEAEPAVLWPRPPRRHNS
jgi:hypothetical protein